MNIDTLKRFLTFLLLALLQVLVFNRIQLFHCATPLVFIYFVIMFPRSHPKWSILLWSFAMGFVIDMFTNTPGVACASLTFAAAIQPYLLELFVPRVAEENMHVSAYVMGWGKFNTFTTLMVIIFCLTFFTLEAFNFFNWLHWLLCVVGSTLLTIVLIMALDTIRK